MATQSLTGVLLNKEREFEYRTSRPATLKQCKEDCLREASSQFGVDGRYKDMWFRGKRCTREWDDNEKVTKDIQILVEGDPYDSGYPEGSNCAVDCQKSVRRHPQSPYTADTVVKTLAEDKLEQFADRVQTRILEGKEERGVTPERVLSQQQKYSTFVQRNAGPFQAFMHKSGLAASHDLEWLAAKGSDLHINRNAKLHSKDAHLRKDAKRMGGFVKMLSNDMPFECALVTHLDWIEQNLFGLS
ncbi:hypothetical protein ABBQ38_007467 [Trebouxia sp. C0009 RCD-2024]